MSIHVDIAPGHAPARPKKIYQQLYVQVLLGVSLGILLGYLRPDIAASFKPLGDAFIKIVKMMIVPVVFCTIVTGLAGLGGQQRIGPTLLKTFGLFYALTIIALLVGIATVEILQPGVGMHIDPHALDPEAAAKYAASAAKLDFIDVLLHIIPTSFFSPFAEGEVLPVLFVAVVLGFGLRRAGAAGQVFVGGLDSFAKGLFAAFGMLMKLAPLGAFGAMAYIVAKNGLQTIGNLGFLGSP